MDMKQSPIQVKDGVVYFYVNESLLTSTGVEALSEALEKLAAQTQPKVMIVDQMSLQHELTPEEDKAWIELYKHFPQYVDKTATICMDIINKLQTNYVLQKEGVSDQVKAFVKADSKEMCNFLGINTFEL